MPSSLISLTESLDNSSTKRVGTKEDTTLVNDCVQLCKLGAREGKG